jgi:hypothetical protein
MEIKVQIHLFQAQILQPLPLLVVVMAAAVILLIILAV